MERIYDWRIFATVLAIATCLVGGAAYHQFCDEDYVAGVLILVLAILLLVATGAQILVPNEELIKKWRKNADA